MRIDIRGLIPNIRRLKRRRIFLKPARPSRKEELWYKTELLRIVRLLQAEAEKTLIPVLKRRFPGPGTLHDADDDLESVFDRMARQFGGIERVAERLAQLAAWRAKGAADRQFVAAVKQAIGVDITGLLRGDGEIARAMADATQANIDLIKSIPDVYFDKLKKAVYEHVSVGVRWESLAKEVRRIGDVTESRAKLIARDQTSKMNSKFNEVRQTSVGIDKYTWSTAHDERVRARHRENDGKVFRWDQPPERTGHPGHDVQCRCVAVPFFDLDAMEEGLF